jgi:Rieske Fe-S protein
MSVEEDIGDQKVTNGEPSRRTFLKVSAVAGATVAAIAAGASMLPKMAASGAAAAKTATSANKAEAETTVSTVASQSDPLILVVRGDAVDVYRGESKIAMQDSTLAKELSARVAAKIQ